MTTPAEVHHYLLRRSGASCTTPGCLFCGDRGEIAEANVPEEVVTEIPATQPVAAEGDLVDQDTDANGEPIEDKAAEVLGVNIDPSGDEAEEESTESDAVEAEEETAEVADEPAADEQVEAAAEIEAEAAAATFSAEEVATAVREEIAAATAKIQAEFQAKVDALEIAVRDEKARADEIAAEFQSYKDELAAEQTMASVREARIAAAKAANPNLGDDFFTEERASAYLAMEETVFTTVILDALATAYAAGPHPFAQPDETADDLDVCAVCGKDAALHTVTTQPDESAAHTTPTSAFTGGKTPTGVSQEATPTSRLMRTKRAQ